jgi:crossover junction endodeoxyribonuclease RuvC
MTRRGKRLCRILGIDPGLHVTGYAAVDFRAGQPVIVEAGVLRTEAAGALADRLARLHAELAGLLRELKPDLAAVERLYSHYAHPRTAILMGHARGVILLACAGAGVPVRDLPATAVKRSLTGNGHASKQQVQRAVQTLCRLREPPSPFDVADALALAICAGRQLPR